MKSLVGSLALIVAMTLAGCGGDDQDPEVVTVTVDPEASASSEAAEAEASQSAAEEQAREDRLAREQAVYDACRQLAGGLLNRLQQIDSRLSVGLNYDEYGDYLGDVRVAYDKLVDKMTRKDFRCTSAVGAPLEKAFNKYSKVLGIWGDCIEDYYCDFSEGETNRTVQAAWADATELIDKAQRALNDMKPDR